MKLDVLKLIEAEGVETQMQLVISPNKDFATAVEALSRGINPVNNERIAPIKLIHAAIKQGVLIQLEQLMLRKALEAFKPIYFDSPSMLLFINIGADFMELAIDNNLIDEIIADYGIPISNIIFDIGAFDFGRLSMVKEFVDTYRAKGYYICIDNLGIDYYNIDRVLYLNPDLVKIVIQSLRQLTHQGYAENMLKTLKLIAESQGIILVAKGIEDESDVAFAIKHGAQFMQGFYISQPVDLTTDSLKNLKERYRDLIAAHSVEEESRLELTRAMTSKAYNIIKGAKKLLGATSEIDRSIEAYLLFETYPMVENFWILDDKGVQFGPTYINEKQYQTKNVAMFQVYSHGSDFSTKDIFTQLYNTILEVWVTPPMKSMLTNNICITCSSRLDFSPEYAVLGININLENLSLPVKEIEKEEDFGFKVIVNQVDDGL